MQTHNCFDQSIAYLFQTGTKLPLKRKKTKTCLVSYLIKGVSLQKGVFISKMCFP